MFSTIDTRSNFQKIKAVEKTRKDFGVLNVAFIVFVKNLLKIFGGKTSKRFLWDTAANIFYYNTVGFHYVGEKVQTLASVGSSRKLIWGEKSL